MEPRPLLCDIGAFVKIANPPVHQWQYKSIYFRYKSHTKFVQFIVHYDFLSNIAQRSTRLINQVFSSCFCRYPFIDWYLCTVLLWSGERVVTSHYQSTEGMSCCNAWRFWKYRKLLKIQIRIRKSLYSTKRSVIQWLNRFLWNVFIVSLWIELKLFSVHCSYGSPWNRFFWDQGLTGVLQARDMDGKLLWWIVLYMRWVVLKWGINLSNRALVKEDRS